MMTLSRLVWMALQLAFIAWLTIGPIQDGTIAPGQAGMLFVLSVIFAALLTGFLTFAWDWLRYRARQLHAYATGGTPPPKRVREPLPPSPYALARLNAGDPSLVQRSAPPPARR